MLITVIGATASPCYGAVDGITKDNYLTYEKPIRDMYGYNKGECERPYLEGEEYFYNEYYDHWNVDLIYDATAIPTEAVKVTKAKAIKKVKKIKKVQKIKMYKKYKKNKR